MPASYPEEALKAQAVCARTYACVQMMNSSLEDLGAQVDDSVSYQVYQNSGEAQASSQAVEATAGEILLNNGSPINAYYFSTSHGQTSTDQVWAALAPSAYLQSVECTYDSQEPWYQWEVEISLAKILANFQGMFGGLSSVTGIETGEENVGEVELATAAFVLEKSLIALHPYIPFVTEHIFQTLTGKDTIMYEEYPDNLNDNFEEEEKGIDKVIEAVSLIRNIRGEYNITPAAQLEIFINTDDNNALNLFQAEIPLIMKMGKAKFVQFNEKTPENCAKSVGNGFEIMVSLEGTINVEEEIARLEKEKKAVEKDVNLYGGKLQNQGYLAKAPAQVIEKDKKTYEEAKARLDKINEALAGLKK